MKLKVFSGLFVIANALNALGNDNLRARTSKDLDPLTQLSEGLDNFKPSIECLAETAKYEACISKKLNLDSSNFDDLKKEEIEKFCTNLESKECQPLVSDVYKTESACLSADGKAASSTNTVFGLLYYSVKEFYLLYCSKTVDGKTCPFSDYILNHPDIIENSTDDVPMDAKEALIADCKDANCNERILFMNKLNDYIDSLHIEGMEEDERKNIEIFNEFIENYKEKKCEAINELEAVVEGKNSTNTNTNNNNTEKSASINVQTITFTSIIMMIVASFMLIM